MKKNIKTIVANILNYNINARIPNINLANIKCPECSSKNFTFKFDSLELPDGENGPVLLIGEMTCINGKVKKTKYANESYISRIRCDCNNCKCFFSVNKNGETNVIIGGKKL